MLLTTGIVALSRKISDERARKREAKQGLLKVGNSDAAKQASAFQIQKTIADDHLQRNGTDLKFENSEELSPVIAEKDIDRRTYELADTEEASPQQEPTENMELSVTTASDGENSHPTNEPPPYVAIPFTPDQDVPPNQRPSSSRNPGLIRQSIDAESISSGSATILSGSDGSRGLRIRTKGSELKSGFPYHPELFDFNVRPDAWERFTTQINEVTKFETKDYARMVGAATATALTGAVVTSVWLGRTMNRSLQEDKVKSGLQDGGKLGELLKIWNENEWRDLGLFVHLELSESAMKRQNQKSSTFQKPSLLYDKREDRERKREERKFCVVVTRLDEEGNPSDAIHRLAEKEKEAAVELDPMQEIAELPGNSTTIPVELPAEDLTEKKKSPLDVPSGYAELESPVVSMKKYDGLDQALCSESLEDLKLASLMVTAETHASIWKEVA